MTSTNPQPSVREAVARYNIGERIADEVEKALAGRQTDCEQAARDVIDLVLRADPLALETEPAPDDVRWLELAQGGAFTIIDRQMLGEMYANWRRAREALALPDGGGSSRDLAQGPEALTHPEPSRHADALLLAKMIDHHNLAADEVSLDMGAFVQEGGGTIPQAMKDAMRFHSDAAVFLAALSHPDPLTVTETSRQGSSGADIAARVASDLAAGDAPRKSEGAFEVHVLKTHPAPFAAVRARKKWLEIRRHDRNFKEGDTLWLEEYDPATDYRSGAVEVRMVTHVLPGGQYGIEPGFCAISMADIPFQVASSSEAPSVGPSEASAGNLPPDDLPETSRQVDGGGWQDIDSAPVAARVEALSARGTVIQGRTTGRGARGRRGSNMVETADGYRHVCTHWRPLPTGTETPSQSGRQADAAGSAQEDQTSLTNKRKK